MAQNETAKKEAKKPRPKRATRKKGLGTKAVLQALLAGLALGVAFVTAELEIPASQPSGLLAVIFVVVTLLVAAAVTDRARTGAVFGAAATLSQFLGLLIFYAYAWSPSVGLDIALSAALRTLTYPLAGLIGGYVVNRTL